jgi:hypothetical protein
VRERIDKQEIFFGTPADLKKQEKKYWDTITSKEKSETITYLRECFYGPEATTGRLQKIYHFFKQK